VAWGYSTGSTHLFMIAKQAAQAAIEEAADARDPVSFKPLISVVFAALAGEAFVNELSTVARHPSVADPELGPEPPEVGDLIELLSEAEDSRAQTGFKFLIGKLALSRHTYDKGTNPYQDFATLMDLRNELVHMKPRRIEGVLAKGVYPSFERPKVIERLSTKGVLARRGGSWLRGDWLSLVSTPATARWACNVTSAIVFDLCASMPPSQFRARAEMHYLEHGIFDPVP